MWWAFPQTESLWPILAFFGIGLLGMEFATIFTNAMLPDLGPRPEIGRISGNGWALGYAGGVMFGAYMGVEGSGTINVGDTLTLGN